MDEGRERCKECKRLLPKPKEPKMSPICKLCKRPLIRAGHFWVCPDRNMSHRGLIPKAIVNKAGFGKGSLELFEV